MILNMNRISGEQEQMAGCCEHDYEPSCFAKCGQFLD